MAIAGWEDHSLDVSGTDHIVTYDDSNVFVNRDGQLNMNTGDTDSSGLNVVDATRSTIRSGNHIENGENDDENNDNDNDENGENGQAGALRPAGAGTTGSADHPAALSKRSDAVALVTDDDGGTLARGHGALAIGADGIDDLGVDVTGARNIVTYDDSNVVTGGTGDVNAQIGDSDTSGAVIMDVTDSFIESGDST